MTTAVADTTTKDNRTFWLSLIIGVGRAGMMAGFTIGGLLTKKQDYSNIDLSVYVPTYRFVLTGLISGLVMYGLVVPETLTEHMRKGSGPGGDGAAWWSLAGIKSFLAGARRKYRTVPWGLMTAYMIVCALFYTRNSLDFLWCFKFWQWGTAENSMYSTVYSLSVIVCLSIVNPLIQAQVKAHVVRCSARVEHAADQERDAERENGWVHEKTSTLVMAIAIGLAGMSVVITMLLGQTIRWLLFYLIPLDTFIYVAKIAGNVILAAAVPADNLGSVSSGIALLSTLSSLSLTQAAATLYGATVETLPFATYYLYAALVAIALTIVLVHNHALGRAPASGNSDIYLTVSCSRDTPYGFCVMIVLGSGEAVGRGKSVWEWSGEGRDEGDEQGKFSSTDGGATVRRGGDESASHLTLGGGVIDSLAALAISGLQLLGVTGKWAIDVEYLAGREKNTNTLRKGEHRNGRTRGGEEGGCRCGRTRTDWGRRGGSLAKPHGVIRKDVVFVRGANPFVGCGFRAPASVPKLRMQGAMELGAARHVGQVPGFARWNDQFTGLLGVLALPVDLEGFVLLSLKSTRLMGTMWKRPLKRPPICESKVGD
ncbi:hypothetical protein BDK51DRAFT_39262 [Blyttiomyces helicus]|uniref:Uncharacterized protein n=1 Tax=Blyttiomyces helicus TaxID=388810 RepID=A0A4P9WAK7_9FUNG|nr:hypothetical protein BDK51DRAFT_39262 [Blyttiomyces helicus]|eukprot:RKO88188.1 hypothetical protein BDK51DRAFT_39262 [Blyttiomyces helicus]